MRTSCNTMPKQRTGYVYIAVLFTSLIVAVAVAGALSLSTLEERTKFDRINRMRAMRIAEGACHLIAAHLNENTNWRNEHTNETYTKWLPANAPGQLGDSRFRYLLRDPDGSLSDDDSDTVELIVHLQVDESEFALAVSLKPSRAASNVLEYGITAFDDIELEVNAIVSSDRPVQVGDDCTSITSGILTAPTVELNGTQGFTIRADIAPANLASLTQDVIAEYENLGTEISILSLPVNAQNKRLIQNSVLSPAINPFSSPNADGIYWIDAKNQVIRIDNCHFNATLAIRNAARIEIGGGMVWHYPKAPDAILVTNSFIQVQGLTRTLSEPDQIQNFNPPGSAYREVSDLDLSDEYPQQFTGIIYTTNNINIHALASGGMMRVVGNLISSDLRLFNSGLSVQSLEIDPESTPIGFIDLQPMEFVHGSWKQVPTPSN